MLQSLIHFELIFVQGKRDGFSFSFLHADTQQHLLKRLSFLYRIFWLPLYKVQWT
jgi:hypothetical protein